MGCLVLLSLVLITLSFRSTALDSVQSAGASVLRPFEVGADRVARPFRDAIGWFHGLVDARSQAKRLEAENEALRQQLILDEGALQENVYLRAQLQYHGPPSVASFERVSAAVLTNPQSEIDQSITIAAGTSSGIAAGDAVITPAGLVGTIDKASGSVSRVTLLTDAESAATATDLTDPAAVGVVRRGGGGSDVLIFDEVPKQNPVNVGDTVITAGSIGKGALPSMFPRGIVIGTVSSQSESDVDVYQSIQIQPAVDFSSLQAVQVLVPKHVLLSR